MSGGGLLHLVEDMLGRLKRLEELQPLASGPELPAGQQQSW